VRGPQFVEYFQPVLKALISLGGSGRPAEVRTRLVEDLDLPAEVQDAQNPSGTSRLNTRIAWARFYLVRAGLVDSSQHGVWAITERGRSEADSLSHEKALALFQSIHSQWPSKQKAESTDSTEEPESAPEDGSSPSAGYREAFVELIRGMSPAAFERFSQRLLRESGFEEVNVTGRSGDRGIDGIGLLQVNALMSMRVLFQCKRYSGTVGPSEIRDFRGAMAGRTEYGVFLTTGSFTVEARREASREGVPPIELVDIDALIGLCEKLRLGLRPVETFAIDAEFFDQFER
jgi:restriction system protein